MEAHECCWCHKVLKTASAQVVHQTYCRYNVKAGGRKWCEGGEFALAVNTAAGR